VATINSGYLKPLARSLSNEPMDKTKLDLRQLPNSYNQYIEDFVKKHMVTSDSDDLSGMIRAAKAIPRHESQSGYMDPKNFMRDDDDINKNVSPKQNISDALLLLIGRYNKPLKNLGRSAHFPYDLSSHSGIYQFLKDQYNTPHGSMTKQKLYNDNDWTDDGTIVGRSF